MDLCHKETTTHKLEKDFWIDLPGHVKAGIERGRKHAAERKLTPHDEVMKRYSKYLQS